MASGWSQDIYISAYRVTNQSIGYRTKYADTMKRLLKYTDYSRLVAIILRPGLKKKLSIILDRRSWRNLSSEIE
jgi:hypothetical protein